MGKSIHYFYGPCSIAMWLFTRGYVGWMSFTPTFEFYGNGPFPQALLLSHLTSCRSPEHLGKGRASMTPNIFEIWNFNLLKSEKILKYLWSNHKFLISMTFQNIPSKYIRTILLGPRRRRSIMMSPLQPSHQQRHQCNLNRWAADMPDMRLDAAMCAA